MQELVGAAGTVKAGSGLQVAARLEAPLLKSYRKPCNMHRSGMLS
jgi:hypothetical protein